MQERRNIKKLAPIFNPSYFRIGFVLSLFLGFFMFLEIILPVIFGFIFFVWAILLLIHGFFIEKTFKKLKFFKIILAFLCASLITVFLNIKINFPGNFVFNMAFLEYFFICFFLFYGIYTQFGKQKEAAIDALEKEINIIFKFIIYATTLANMIGFLCLFLKQEIKFNINILNLRTYNYTLGLYKGVNEIRFTGVFTNPNILAFASVCSIAFCITLLFKQKNFKYLQKRIIILIFCAIINFVALVLSDSIASFLFLAIYIVSLLFYNTILKNSHMEFKKILLRCAIFFSICIILICSLLAVKVFLQSGAPGMFKEITNMISEKTTQEPEPDIKFGRPNHNVKNGSGRKLLLKQAMVYVKRHPAFGISRANIEYYGKKYFEYGVAYPNFHNGYVSILVCYGIIGFVLFCTFFIGVLIILLRCIINKANANYPIFKHLFCMLVSASVYVLFEETLFSEINFMSVFFWLILGYTMAYANFILKDKF